MGPTATGSELAADLAFAFAFGAEGFYEAAARFELLQVEVVGPYVDVVARGTTCVVVDRDPARVVELARSRTGDAGLAGRGGSAGLRFCGAGVHSPAEGAQEAAVGFKDVDAVVGAVGYI